MTYDELVKQVAEETGMVFKRKGGTKAEEFKSYNKVDSIIRCALNVAADAAKEGAAPKFPGVGRFVLKTVRSTGRKPDGTTWTKPGRTKLALAPSLKRGGKASAGVSAASSVAA